MCRFGAGVPEPTHEPGGRENTSNGSRITSSSPLAFNVTTQCSLSAIWPFFFASPAGCVYSSGNYHSERIYAARFRIVDTSALLTPPRLMIEDTAWLNLRWLKKSR